MSCDSSSSLAHLLVPFFTPFSSGVSSHANGHQELSRASKPGEDGKCAVSSLRLLKPVSDTWVYLGTTVCTVGRKLRSYLDYLGRYCTHRRAPTPRCRLHSLHIQLTDSIEKLTYSTGKTEPKPFRLPCQPARQALGLVLICWKLPVGTAIHSNRSDFWILLTNDLLMTIFFAVLAFLRFL